MEFCKHHQYLISEHFHHPQKKLRTPKKLVPILHFSQTLATTNLLSASTDLPYLLQMESYMTGFTYHIVSCVCISFLFIAKYYSIIWIYHILFMHKLNNFWVYT